MTIALLDPMLFLHTPHISLDELTELNHVMRTYKMEIPLAPFYWKKFQSECVRPLHARVDRDYLAALDQLRHHSKELHLPALPSKVSVWSFRNLFSKLEDTTWLDVMPRIAAQCSMTGKPTVVLSRLLNGRNVREHSSSDANCINEKTIWNLRVQLVPGQVARIPIVCTRRNISVPWSCRFDDKLPADTDGATFPFCPSPDWENNPSLTVCRTHQSRPAWVDSKGNHWAEPSTPDPQHWDVYLNSEMHELYGINQLNICKSQAPLPFGKAAGDIHHVPKDKKPRLRQTAGWSC
jgi:hypothetical protein